MAPPAMPPEAQTQTADGAMAFARYYFAVVDYAYASGDTAPLAAISDPDCRSCAGIKRMIDEVVSSSGTFQRGPIAISEISEAGIQPEGWAELMVTYSTPRFRRMDDSGAVTLEFPPEVDQRFLMIIVPASIGWQMRSLHETA